MSGNKKKIIFELNLSGNPSNEEIMKMMEDIKNQFGLEHTPKILLKETINDPITVGYRIDPPMGWKYGFPREVTIEEYESGTDLKELCIKHGYPKDLADSFEPLIVGVTTILSE